MQRSKKILIASHCVLNQNVVVNGEDRSPGMMRSAVQWVDSQGYGFYQLPCPEFTFLGMDRPPMTYEQYNTPEYRAHARKILSPVLEDLKKLRQSGYEIVGCLAIQQSPSCDPNRGVFMEELQAMAQEAGIPLATFWQIPATETGFFDPADPATRAAK